MRVRKTSVEISEELLTAVQRELGTTTVDETIEQAFREVLRANPTSSVFAGKSRSNGGLAELFVTILRVPPH
jgi:Arc/MetJ family transcription regulator